MKSPFLFTIIALPQEYSGGELRFNVVFIPRNISPINDLSAWGFPNIGPFADAGSNFQLEAKIISTLDDLPTDVNIGLSVPLNVEVPSSARPIYEELQVQFDIDDIPNSDQIPPPVQTTKFIKKYLPVSYRKSFNFTNPRTKDAVIDDSYHCAFKDKGKDPNFRQSSDRVSWGKVYGHCLRQPALARQVGLIYTDLSITVPSNIGFEDGGWLYVDFPSSAPHFYTDVQTTPNRHKCYAARIPAMEANTQRSLFAPVLFPVGFSAPVSSNFDEVQREAADYDDGFAKIVHAFQPISTNFLQEEADVNMILPTKDVGIRLGWDDEQVLIWQNRQLKEDPSVGAGQRLDAPLGVTQYHIDVREVGSTDWISLNTVRPRATLTLAGATIMGSNEEIELGTEVYPMQLNSNANANYWLPAYFTQWSGKSMVLPDEDAHAIYRIAEEVRSYETGDDDNNGNPIQRALSVALNRQYFPVGLENMNLRYGTNYEFRVRMGDISGGGPTAGDARIFEAIAQDTSIIFKRNVAPNAVRMDNIPDNGAFFEASSLLLRRPIIEYPNIEFTGFYDDVVNKLISYALWTEGKGVAVQLEDGTYTTPQSYPVGLPDPDTNTVEITVEVKGLNMDHKLSASGREAYYKLYTVRRDFNELSATAAVLGDPSELDPFADIESPLELPIEFRDATSIDFDDTLNFGEWPVTMEELETNSTIILPTARDIRITVKALGAADDSYYGLEAWNKGKTTQFMMRQAPTEELDLFNPAFLTDAIEGVYLQPNKVRAITGLNRFISSNAAENETTLIQRFAQQMDLETRGNSLIAYPGVRAQFGCSRAIRHSLAPDGTALTFSTQTDLVNHWLVGVHFRLQRDWSWDAMQLESFTVLRSQKFGRAPEFSEPIEVGTINLYSTINLQALSNPDRSFTQLVFIDAVEPKKDPNNPNNVDAFPDIIELVYTIVPNFKIDQIPVRPQGETTLDLVLPVTTIPAQEPILASAGLALSPYKRDEKYANTESRRKFLWLELKEPIQDPNDALFVRLLAYAPDPMLSDLARYPELLEPPIEPAIPLDPELIRVIRPDQADDNAGLNAMLEMHPAIVQAGQAPRHFLVPLPPGLHADSDELFGFFTYELRIGHKDIWSTAQGRFGRPLRVTGTQHPAPNLFCTVERTEEEIKVVAPYATAVHDGKNVTAFPPRTELWALIYAQVKMADNQDYRNILLNEIRLEPNRRNLDEIRDIRDVGIFNRTFTSVQAFGPSANSDKKQYGSSVFNIKAIQNLLEQLGLPKDSSLSVLTVEFLPTNYGAMVSEQQNALIKANSKSADPFFKKDKLSGITPEDKYQAYPLSRDLGEYRIMRTSPLVAVPDICCVDC